MLPRPQAEPRVGRRQNIPRPERFSAEQQSERFGPKFDRLREVLAGSSQGLSITTDPGAIAPERLLVFELRGAVDAFAAAVSRVGGLEFIDEEILAADEADGEAVAYLLVPDMQALRQIESLWRRWSEGEVLATGFTPWRDVFSLLRDLRPWGPQDRVGDRDAATLTQEIEGRGETDLIRLEVELVYRDSQSSASRAEAALVEAVEFLAGSVVSRSRISEIAYHAVLVDLPVAAVRAVVGRQGIAGIESVLHIRPQSIASRLDVADAEAVGQLPEVGELGEPILALLDGVPVANHPLLRNHLSIDDPLGLESITAVSDRKHGTAMASLIVHGDRNKSEQPLARKIHVLPVMAAESGRDETFQSNRLIVDVIFQAVRTMRAGPEPTAPNVLIVNLSLGNARQPFHRSISAWAKLLDRLAYEYGILFVVSAGNVLDTFEVPDYSTRTAFEDADPNARAVAVLGAIGGLAGQRKLISPAETINGITVGACNLDDVQDAYRSVARSSVEPFSGVGMANPSSALGPGFGSAVKPDILMPGSRERLWVQGNTGQALMVRPASPARAAGLKVAAPPVTLDEQFESYTGGTSAAAALASRTCHRIHDALEEAYGDDFLALSNRQRAVLIKALVAHTAQWPDASAEMIRRVLGPAGGRNHVRQKDNIRRFLGYGLVNAEDATACAGDRATFWATGEIFSNQVMHIPVPIPLAIANRALPHAIVATVAWFTPTNPSSRRYRAVRLKLLRPAALGALGLQESFSNQPDHNQGSRGTLYHQRWYGERVAEVTDGMELILHLQREADQAGLLIDDAAPFAVAVTLTMPGVSEIYDQVRQRLGVALGVR